jgi:hypothetical protein
MIEFYLHLGDRRFGSFALYLVVFEYSGFRDMFSGSSHQRIALFEKCY